MKKLIELLEKKFLTEHEFEIVNENEYVKSVEDCGMSGTYYHKTWYCVTLENGDEFDIYLND